MIGFVLGCGWASATIDWRGQGLSGRMLADPRKGHVADFAEYQSDAEAFLRVATEQDLPRPWIVLANSMGGAIAMRLLRNRPEIVEGAVLLAPMLSLRIGRLGRIVAEWLARGACLMGRGSEYAARCDSRTVTERGYPRNPLTACEPRFRRLEQIEQNAPRATLGGVTWGWLRAALKETRALRALPPGDPAETPILILVGDSDRVIDIESLHDVARDSLATRLVIIPDCLHSLPLERDPIVERMNSEIAAFLQGFRQSTATGKGARVDPGQGAEDAGQSESPDSPYGAPK